MSNLSVQMNLMPYFLLYTLFKVNVSGFKQSFWHNYFLCYIFYGKCSCWHGKKSTNNLYNINLSKKMWHIFLFTQTISKLNLLCQRNFACANKAFNCFWITMDSIFFFQWKNDARLISFFSAFLFFSINFQSA